MSEDWGIRSVSTVLPSMRPDEPDRRIPISGVRQDAWFSMQGRNKRSGDAESLLDGSTGTRVLGLDPKIVKELSCKDDLSPRLFMGFKGECACVWLSDTPYAFAEAT